MQLINYKRISVLTLNQSINLHTDRNNEMIKVCILLIMIKLETPTYFNLLLIDSFAMYTFP